VLYWAVLLLVFLLLPASPAEAARELVASDDFNRANEDPLSGGGNWGQLHDTSNGDLQVSSNKVISDSTSGSEKTARWVGAGSFTDDQYSSLVISGFGFFGNSYQAGVIARASADTGTGRDYYAYYITDDGDSSKLTKLVKVVNGSETTLASSSIAWTGGDRVEIEVEGTTIRGLKNGVEQHSSTDSALTTGKPGVWMRGDSGVPQGDDWEGGNIPAPITSGRRVTEAGDCRISEAGDRRILEGGAGAGGTCEGGGGGAVPNNMRLLMGVGG
jgi:hypothetical protein